jgi:hypothetical protein
MLTKAKIVLSAAIVLSTAFSASAATRPHAVRVHRTPIYNMVPGYTPRSHSISNDPARTGGGSLGTIKCFSSTEEVRTRYEY